MSFRSKDCPLSQRRKTAALELGEAIGRNDASDRQDNILINNSSPGEPNAGRSPPFQNNKCYRCGQEGHW